MIWGNGYARFGWVDFENNPEIARAQFKAAKGWVREQGMDGIHGPLGFADMDHEGMLVEGFNEPGTMATIYNHPYYPKIVESLGYVKDVDWVEFEVMVPERIPEKAERVEWIVIKRLGLRVLDAETSRRCCPMLTRCSGC